MDMPTPCKHASLLSPSVTHIVPSQGQSEVKYFLHNHLRFTILYHKDLQTDLARIVGFEVEPFSVKHEYEAPYDKSQPVLNTCNPGRMIYVTHDTPPQPVQEGVEVIFSYDVKFVVGDGTAGDFSSFVRLWCRWQMRRFTNVVRLMLAGQRHPVGISLGHVPADD